MYTNILPVDGFSFVTGNTDVAWDLCLALVAWFKKETSESVGAIRC